VFDDNPLQPLRNRSIHRYGFHAFIISALSQLAVGLPGKLDKRRDRFLALGEIKALPLDRCSQKAPQQFRAVLIDGVMFSKSILLLRCVDLPAARLAVGAPNATDCVAGRS
jgi:hypothetical protein